MEPDTFYQRLKHNDFIFENIGDGYKIYEKDRFEKFKFKKSKDFIPPEIAQQNSSDLLNIFGKKVFDYPKPLPLIEYVINCALSKTYNPNINIENNLEYTILDFFAGSGTTGHAVLKLNAKDNIKRKMILCTNNENNIARDVTYERLKTVITGKRKDGSKYSDGYKASLKYLKVFKHFLK